MLSGTATCSRTQLNLRCNVAYGYLGEKIKQSLRPSCWREAGSAFLCDRLFACDHFQFDDVDDRLPFAPWAEQWEIDENRIIEHLDSGFAATKRITDPERFFRQINIISHFKTAL